jgi:hypothetical protein
MAVDSHPQVCAVSVTTLFATPWRLPDAAGVGTPPPELPPGFHQGAADRHPNLVYVKPLRESEKSAETRAATEGSRWLLRLPSGRIVAALHLEIHHPLSDLPGLLEDCLLRRPTLEKEGLHPAIEDLNGIAIHSNGSVDGASTGDSPPIDRHQLVLARVAYPADPTQTIQWLVENLDHPLPPGTALSYPAALNRLHSTAAVVTPLLSVLCNHPSQIESGATLSAALALGSAANLHEIRTRLRGHTRSILSPGPTGRYPRSGRRARRIFVKDLARLELDLGQAIETPADLDCLARSPEVLAYHRALAAVVGLSSRASAVEQHLRQLDATVRARLAPPNPEPGRFRRWLHGATNQALHRYSSEHRDI